MRRKQRGFTRLFLTACQSVVNQPPITFPTLPRQMIASWRRATDNPVVQMVWAFAIGYAVFRLGFSISMALGQLRDSLGF